MQHAADAAYDIWMLECSRRLPVELSSSSLLLHKRAPGVVVIDIYHSLIIIIHAAAVDTLSKCIVCDFFGFHAKSPQTRPDKAFDLSNSL